MENAFHVKGVNFAAAAAATEYNGLRVSMNGGEYADKRCTARGGMCAAQCSR